jgi:hypothetical protein
MLGEHRNAWHFMIATDSRGLSACTLWRTTSAAQLLLFWGAGSGERERWAPLRSLQSYGSLPSRQPSTSLSRLGQECTNDTVPLLDAARQRRMPFDFTNTSIACSRGTLGERHRTSHVHESYSYIVCCECVAVCTSLREARICESREYHSASVMSLTLWECTSTALH